ncbi:hypothetical protein K3495_g2402 [Podosphaera aphanis]|nr:hypothetical protein K3495_g2402 [Podosphaera aphanis]
MTISRTAPDHSARHGPRRARHPSTAPADSGYVIGPRHARRSGSGTQRITERRAYSNMPSSTLQRQPLPRQTHARTHARQGALGAWTRCGVWLHPSRTAHRLPGADFQAHGPGTHGFGATDGRSASSSRHSRDA